MGSGTLAKIMYERTWEIHEIRCPATVSGGPDRPARRHVDPGVVIHRSRPLHPDDVTALNGIPVTSPSRTLIDCAEFMTVTELRTAFARAREIGLLDLEALRAAASVSNGGRRSRCSMRSSRSSAPED